MYTRNVAGHLMWIYVSVLAWQVSMLSFIVDFGMDR